MSQQFIRTHTGLLDVGHPMVMAILNLTPDSFYTSVGTDDEVRLLTMAEKALCEGAQILDIGGYSTRPGAEEVTEAEEWRRIEKAAAAIRRLFPDAILSVDTFRAEVARRAVEQYAVDIINDVSGGQLDEQMFSTVSQLRVPYILTHMRGTPATMQSLTQYDDLMRDIIDYFQQKVYQLHQMGVRDIIIDPGFGFSKTLEQNYELLSKMHYLSSLGLPLLAGVSHKSMIYRLLGTTPAEALNGTTALHMVALMRGATILRAHEVKEAVETIRIYKQLTN